MAFRLPEVREDEATREIELIYADIRRCLRLPLINLIYRHLATIPGMLPHTWGWVREMMMSGELELAHDRLTGSLKVPLIEPLHLFPSGHLSHIDWVAIRRVLKAYNRGNGLNLIALSVIKTELHQRACGALKIAKNIPETDVLPLPRLLKLSDLNSDTTALVETMSQLHGGNSGVIPSLYLHLANWPEFLRAACVRVKPLLKDGSMARARQEAVELADIEVKNLSAMFSRGSQTGGYSDQVIETLAHFTTQVIPEMLPVGLALEQACMHGEK